MHNVIANRRKHPHGLFTTLPEAADIVQATEALQPGETLQVEFKDALRATAFRNYCYMHYRGLYRQHPVTSTTIQITRRRYPKLRMPYGERKRLYFKRILEAFAARGFIHFAAECSAGPKREYKEVDPQAIHSHGHSVQTLKELKGVPPEEVANLEQLSEAVLSTFPRVKGALLLKKSPPPENPANRVGEGDEDTDI